MLVAQIKYNLREQQNWVPSISASMIHNCFRFLWYANVAKLNPTRRPNPRLSLEEGKIQEEFVISLIEKYAKVKVYARQERVEVNGIPGHIDGLFDLNGKTHLLEIKAFGEWSYDIFTDKGIYAVHPSYKYQHQLYLGGLRKKYNVVGGLFVVKNMTHSEIDEQSTEFDEVMFESLLDTTTRAAELKTMTQPPQRPFTIDSDECTECPVREHCWDMPNEPTSLELLTEEFRPQVIHIAEEWAKYEDNSKQAEVGIKTGRELMSDVLSALNVSELIIPIADGRVVKASIIPSRRKSLDDLKLEALFPEAYKAVRGDKHIVSFRMVVK